MAKDFANNRKVICKIGGFTRVARDFANNRMGICKIEGLRDWTHILQRPNERTRERTKERANNCAGLLQDLASVREAASISCSRRSTAFPRPLCLATGGLVGNRGGHPALATNVAR